MKILYKIQTSHLVLKLKRVIERILINKTVGRVLTPFLKQSIPFYGTKIVTSSLNDLQKAAIFFKRYETREIYFVNKYLINSIPTIELGSSIGIVSCQIAKINKCKKIFVEANPTVLKTIDNNLHFNQFDNYVIVNGAIAYTEDDFITINLHENNLVGNLYNKLDGGSAVRVYTLSDILKLYNIEEYCLVMDIEGAEFELIQNDPLALINCKRIIAEFHDFEYAKNRIHFSEVIKMCEEAGFRVVDQYYNRAVLDKS